MSNKFFNLERKEICYSPEMSSVCATRLLDSLSQSNTQITISQIYMSLLTRAHEFIMHIYLKEVTNMLCFLDRILWY